MKRLGHLFILFSFSVFAVPEKDLETTWEKVIYPWYQSLERGEFINHQKLTLRFVSLVKPENKKTLLIIPGQSEPALKYAETAFDLKDSGVDIFILDHQGQGESERILAPTDKGHVNAFEDYVSDLSLFVGIVKKIKNNSEKLILAHSMGGAITVRFLSQQQNIFKKAVLIAPMMKINTKPYSEPMARYYSTILVKIGKGQDYAPGKGPYRPEESLFETNTVTQSRARFNISKFIFTSWPHLVVGGPTTKWVHEGLKATKDIHKIPYKTETLLFQAGLDEIVVNDRQTNFCKSREDLCRLIYLKDAKHEILMEKDSIRSSVLAKVKDFFELSNN
jgi:lysophospholipase